MDCRASGTMCASRIFLRSAGILHSDCSESNMISDHSAARSSVGRTNTFGASLKAAPVVG
jgi:hypothetical protein